MRRRNGTRHYQNGHDGPLNPSHRNIDCQVSDEVLRKTGREGGNQGAAEQVDQNAEEKSEGEANSTVDDSAAKGAGILGPETAQAEIAPDRVREEFAAKIEKSFHRLRAPAKRNKCSYLPLPFAPEVCTESTRART